jgi:excisionase family DNA binding protein
MQMTYFTPRSIAVRWQCSPRHVQRLIASGRLKATMLGKRLLRVSRKDLQAFEAAGRRRAFAIVGSSSATPAEALDLPPVILEGLPPLREGPPPPQLGRLAGQR